MKVGAHKKCNICCKTVAVKGFLRYHTIDYYVTIPSDDTTWYDSLSATTKGKVHICSDCWLDLKIAIDRMRDNRNDNK